MKVQNMGDRDQGTIFALAYGPSGSGKTHLGGTLGELGKVLFIDIDRGSKTLRNAPAIKQYLSNITVVDFTSFSDLDQAAQLVEANDPDKWNTHFNKGLPTDQVRTWIDSPFDWIVWDTWSEIQWYMLEKLRERDSDMKGHGLSFRKNIQIQDWGSMTDLNKLAVRELRQCAVNQLFLMQEKADKDEITGARYGGPAIHGQMVTDMPTYFDVVIHTGADIQGNFTATTKIKGLWPGKTRLGVGSEIKNPTAKKVFNL